MKPRKDLLDIRSLTDQEITHILDTALPFRDLFQRSIKKVPALRGKTVLTLFHEPSTRTLSSFEIAANRLSADVTNFPINTSSLQKGESILDTIHTLEAMKTDYIIVRHTRSGVPNIIAKHTKASVINAGDGSHEHPTQALLDAFTLRQTLPTLQNKKILIVGDIRHSRVARSTSTILHRLGAHIALLGPGTLIPKNRPPHLTAFTQWQHALAWKPHVIYLLRVQLERQGEPFFPSLKEYHNLYGLTLERLHHLTNEGIYLMHPGPVNRGVELCDEAMNYPHSLINQQVQNGIAIRMAVLFWLKPNLQQRND